MSSRLLPSLILVGLLVAVASCSDPSTPRVTGAVPVMVVGEATSSASPDPSPSGIPSGSPRPVVVRPTPTPRPGLYARPAWKLMVVGDDVMNAAFYKQLHWGTFWPEIYKAEPPLAYLRTMSGETTVGAVARLDAMLTGIKDTKFVAVTYGTSDVRKAVPVETFKGNLRAIVTKLRANQMTVIMSSIPYGTAPKLAEISTYNDALLAVRKELDVEAGPDLFGHFRDHPEQLDTKTGYLLAPGVPKITSDLWSTVIGRVAEGEPTLSAEVVATAEKTATSEATATPASP